MISRSHRVSKILFDSVMGKSVMHHSPFFTVRVGSHQNSEPALAVVVSKKVDRRATKRNTFRRRAYSALEGMIPNMKPGSVSLIFLKKGCEKLAWREYAVELGLILKKAGVLII